MSQILIVKRNITLGCYRETENNLNLPPLAEGSLTGKWLSLSEGLLEALGKQPKLTGRGFCRIQHHQIIAFKMITLNLTQQSNS